MKITKIQATLILMAFAFTTAWAQLAPEDTVANRNNGMFTYMKNKKARAFNGNAAARSNAWNRAEQRPSHVNNALKKYFPPVFSQDQGSCSYASFLGYDMTWERNCYYGLDGSLEDNQLCTHFSYLGCVINSTSMDTGAPTVTDYGGRTYSKLFGPQSFSSTDFGWMQGYDKWYRTAFNRNIAMSNIPCNMMTEEGREMLKDWLWNHWGDHDFLAGGVARFSMAGNGETFDNIPSTATNRAIGLAGKKYVVDWGPSTNHSQTIVGYDDRIEFDLDSNGVYGEKDKDEVGAWIVCNSWGDGWCNGGFVYCPYARAYTNASRTTPWTVDVEHFYKDYRPLRMLKVKMQYSKRSLIQLSADATADTAVTAPRRAFVYSHFNYRGNNLSRTEPYPAVPMLGRWIDGMHYEPMELGMDLTQLTPALDRRKPIKYFFTINTKSDVPENKIGEGRVYSASIIDYELDPNGIEFPFTIEDMKITGSGKTYTISVIVPGEQINAPVNLVATDDGKLSWQKPSNTSVKIDKYLIYCNDLLLDSVENTANDYTPAASGANVYSVSAVYDYRGNKIESAHSNGASFAEVDATKDNKVLDFRNAQAICEGVDFDGNEYASLEMWLKPHTIAKNNNLVGHPDAIYMASETPNGASAGVQFGILYSANNTRFWDADTWHHIALTINRDTINMYIDGKFIAQREISNTKYVGNMGEFYLGFDTGKGKLDAEIDEVRLWRRTLSADEIAAHYNSPIARPEQQDGLWLYYKMDTFTDPVDGQTYIRDYARGHHARIIEPDNVTCLVDNSIFDNKDFACDINAPKETVYAGSAMQFSSTASITASQCEWSVNGKVVSTLVSPYIIFENAGTHTLSLKATSATGQVATSEIKINAVEPPMPVADFEVAIDNLPAKDAFSFINHSTGINCTYHWSMPGADVEEQDATNAMARFLEVGSYQVTLTATNAAGSSSVTKSITAVASAPQPQFGIEPSAVLIGDKVYFTDKSLYGPETWQWEINHVNGKHNYIIHAQNTAFTPQYPGRYNLTLKCSNPQGTVSKTQRMAFSVSNADPGTGLYFQGGESLAIPTLFTSTVRSLTIDTWLHPYNLDGALAMSTEDGLFSTICNTDGSLTLTFNGKSQTSAPSFVVPNEWHHYAFSISAGTVKFYRDAELFSQPSGKVSLTSPAWTGSLVLAGKETQFNGMIDELRIWNKALAQSKLQAICNQPMSAEEITAAVEQQGLLAYYQFNQSSGNVLDATGNNNTATRIDFGPDGDAWSSSLGVFTLDFEGGQPDDVTDQYITNPRAPFLTTGQSVSTASAASNLELLTGDERSTWQLANTIHTDKATTGAYVNKSLNSDMNIRTGYYGFADTLLNHTIYQTLSLPAGYYQLTVHKGASGAFAADSSYLCVVMGSEFVDMTNYEKKSEAFVSLSDTTVSFTVGEEQQVTIGMIINIKGWNGIDIAGFTLMCTPVEVLKPDDETSVYETVQGNPDLRYTPMANAIRVIHPTEEPLRVYSLDGTLQFDQPVEGVHIIPFHPGIYIVNGHKLEVK